jgi:cardiolipin hydrolase
MDEIIAHLTQSIGDDLLSKQERSTFIQLISKTRFNAEQRSYLQTKIYELAKEKITAENGRFILDWVKNVNIALAESPKEISNVYFSPGETCRKAIIDQINKALANIDICVFTISDDLITNAIISAHNRGISIRILTDNDKTFDRGSDIAQLARTGIIIKMDNTPDHMHHKFMIVDKLRIVTGSYNWTISAARVNHENIVLTNDEDIVSAFLQEFNRLWQSMGNY